MVSEVLDGNIINRKLIILTKNLLIHICIRIRFMFRMTE
jgi:hypothetical protein